MIIVDDERLLRLYNLVEGWNVAIARVVPDPDCRTTEHTVHTITIRLPAVVRPEDAPERVKALFRSFSASIEAIYSEALPECEALIRETGSQGFDDLGERKEMLAAASRVPGITGAIRDLPDSFTTRADSR